MINNLNIKKIIEYFINNYDLSTTDPYDMWTLDFGIKTKKIFYDCGISKAFHRIIILFFLELTGLITFFTKKREYPIVRGLATQSTLNLYLYTKKNIYINTARNHLLFLPKNYSKGYSGYCWGLNQPWMSKNTFYPEDTPHVTHTPYSLEAFIRYRKVTSSKEFDNVIRSVFYFLEKDIPVMHNSKDELAVGYSPLPEKYVVINANSYVMYMYALLMEFYPDKKAYIEDKILKLYNFIIRNQEPDGSWWYYVKGAKGNFIDCFHSCFIMKNIYKTAQLVDLPDWKKVVEKGYKYLADNFLDKRIFLVKRFTKTDKFNPVKWDLYDNAEFLNLSILLGKMDIAERNLQAILKTFVKNEKTVYSQVWIGGIKRYKNTLRWAVMPFIYVLSEYLLRTKNDSENKKCYMGY